MISQKEEMRTGTESSGVVLHDMIERIYYYFIIFSQKRNGKRETHGRRGSSWEVVPAYGMYYFVLLALPFVSYGVLEVSVGRKWWRPLIKIH
jgi:hypothetical protein